MPWPPPECQAAGGEVGTGMLSFAVADVTVWERKRQNSLSQLLAFVPLTLLHFLAGPHNQAKRTTGWSFPRRQTAL